MLAKRSDKRRARRVDAELPLLVDGQPGITRNLSASGMFLETDTSYRIGTAINVALNLDTPWGKATFSCYGKIVRLERGQDRVRVAVQFIEGQPPRQRRKAGSKRSE